MTTGQRIKIARKKADMTQKALAEKLGLSPQSVAQWENDLRKPKIETLQRIAFALGVRIEDILGFEAFESGAEFDKRWKENAESSSSDNLTVIHTTDPRKVIDFALNQLNEEGQQKAAERVAELTEIPRYKK